MELETISPLASPREATFALFLQHVEQNRYDEVRDALINGEISTDQRDERYGLHRTALHVAAGAAALDTFTLLVDHGYSLGEVDSKGRTVLYYAIFSWANIESTLNKGDTWKATPVSEVTNPHSVEIVRSIVSDYETANVSAVTADGSTAFHCAAMVGNPEIFSMLLSIQDNINATDGLQRTALHLAVWANREEIVQQLVSRGANVHLRNKIGRTPLHVAAVYGRTNICQQLLKAGADVDAQTHNGDSSLMCALKDRFLETSRLFVEHDANELLHNMEGDNPLTLAIRNFPELAFMMLNKRRKVTGSQIYGDRCEAVYDFTDLDTKGLPVSTNTNPEGSRLGKLKPRQRNHLFDQAQLPSPLELIVAAPSGDLSLLSHPVIIKLLGEKWKAFAARRFYAQTVRYIIVLALWMYVNSSASAQLYGPPYVRLVCESVVVLWCLYTLGSSLRLLRGPVRRKLRQLLGWNGYIMVTSVLILSIIPLRILRASSRDAGLVIREHELVSLSSLLLWCYLLRFLSVIYWTGAFVRMIARMCSDVLKFMFVFFFVLVGFGQAFFLVFRGIDARDELMGVDRYPHEFNTLPQAVMSCFRLMTGNFDFDALSSSDQFLPFALYVLFVLFATFLMANLLLAMMQSTYEEVKRNSELQWRLNWATEIVRIESQLSRRSQRRFREQIGNSLVSAETVLQNRKLTVDDCVEIVTSLLQLCGKSESTRNVRFSKLDEKLLHLESALVPHRQHPSSASYVASRRGSSVHAGTALPSASPKLTHSGPAGPEASSTLTTVAIPEDAEGFTFQCVSPKLARTSSTLSEMAVAGASPPRPARDMARAKQAGPDRAVEGIAVQAASPKVARNIMLSKLAVPEHAEGITVQAASPRLARSTTRSQLAVPDAAGGLIVPSPPTQATFARLEREGSAAASPAKRTKNVSPKRKVLKQYSPPTRLPTVAPQQAAALNSPGMGLPNQIRTPISPLSLASTKPRTLKIRTPTSPVSPTAPPD